MFLDIILQLRIKIRICQHGKGYRGYNYLCIFLALS